jgi:hypothetical protein
MHSTPAPPSAPPAAVIRLRLDRFEALAAEHGLTTDKEWAERIGVDRSTFNRVRRGEIVPGERFIGGCLMAFPGAKFEDMFAVVAA